jgi:isoleucyl-tRNA synthetase
MHTAQWHYPFEHQELFEEQFPADFIAEGVDQTRGWFYTLLVTSTLLYEERPYPHPFRHVVVNLMGLDAEGRKMSKSLGNVLDPWDLINRFGADAVRWYFYSSSAPWKDKRLSLQAVADFQGPLETLRNVYGFFALYASIDQALLDPHLRQLAAGEGEQSRRSLVDRWILSRLQTTIQSVTSCMDDYDIVGAADALKSFVDDLSNWYVRNSRARFWGNEWTADKTAAFTTLYEVLLDLAKLFAPFVPFVAEAIYQNLKTAEMPESVHLCEWPCVNERLRDANLEADMKCVRQIVTAGLQARNKANIKVRQPLRKAVFYLRRGSPSERRRIIDTYSDLIKSELNVKEIEAEDLVSNLHKYGQIGLTLNKSKLGPKLGRLLPKIEQAVGHLRQSGAIVGEELRLEIDGQVIKLTQSEGEYERAFHPHKGFMAGHEGDATVILYTQIDDALRQEGLVREFVRLVQECRKEAGFEVSDRIELYYEADPEVRTAIEKFSQHVQEETLAVALRSNGAFGKVEFSKELDVNGQKAKIGLVRKR